MKIPADRRFFVSNGSDLTPSIHYTKNIDFDEEGYLKLSPPFPRLVSSEDTANFDILADMIMIGTASGQDYKAVTDSGVYDVDPQALTVTLDAGAPAGVTSESRFVGWKGADWYISDASDIYSLQSTAGTVWDIENTDSGNYAEIFVNRNSLTLATANTVQQYTEANMDGTTPPATNSGVTLTIPANFEILGMAYSNYRMGLATRNTTGGSAYFFVWDGATTSASLGIPVNAPMILDIVAYKNSWVILTSIGQLLYYNGSGFDILGNLPTFYFNTNWLILQAHYHGRTMYTDGDIIYFNIGTLLESSNDDGGILPGFYSGVWCYDPVVGIYHRYGLAYSKMTTGSIAATSGTFSSTGHKLLSGDRVLYESGIKIYYAIYVTADTFKLADSYDEATAGTASADFGTSSYALTWIKREDWAQLIANNQNFGAVCVFSNGTNLNNDGVLPFFANLQVADATMTSRHLTSIMAPAFDNLGCIAYSKVKAQGTLDNWQKLNIKYRPLQGGDKIVVKYKYKDFYPAPICIGEAGDITADTGTTSYITWSDSDTFTTTADLSLVEVGHEVEFYSGAGAGSTAHISSITENAGTYTVNLDEAIRGAESGKKSTCVIDAFYKQATITKDTEEQENMHEVPIGIISKWLQVKLELRGRNVTVEELEIVSNPHHL